MEAVFLKVLNMGIAAGWLILAVIVLRALLKRAPKAFRCVLWAFVGIRLLCPFSLETTWSLIPSGETLSPNLITGNSFRVDTGFSAVDTPVNDYLGDHYFEGVTVPAGHGSRVMTALAVIWLAGAAVMLLYALISYLRLRKNVREAIRLRDDLWICDGVRSPFILGVVKPRIYLPSDLDEARLAPMIAHENAHLKRRDHWWKPIGYLLLTVYWFNPLVWLAYVLLCRDIELACDEKVVKEMDAADKKAYSRALLSRSAPRRMVAACPLAFGEVGVKARVKSVLRYKKPAFWVILAAVAACVVLAVCFLTDPADPVKPGSGDVMEQNGYRITEMVTEQSMDVRVPLDVISKDAWTEEGHSFEPDEVVLGQIGGTTLYLRQVRTISGGTDEDYLFFVLDLSHEISDYGTIRTIYTPEIKNGRTAAFVFGMGLMAGEVRDSAATYEDTGYFRGGGPEDEIWVGVTRSVVWSAADYISFRLFGFTDISYEQGEASHEDDILIRTAQELAERTAQVVSWKPKTGGELILPEYPYTTFTWTSGRIEAYPDGKSEGTVLFGGETVGDVYLADLTGDGYRDFCSTVIDGDGSSVLVHDYVAGVTFGLSNRGPYNYALSMIEESGSRMFGSALQVTCSDPETGTPVAVGTLTFTKDGLTMISNAGVEFGMAIAAEFGNVPDDYQAYYNSEIEDAIGFSDYLWIRRSLDLNYGDKVPTYFLSPDKKTLIAVKQDKEGTNYSWTFVKNEASEWEAAGEVLTMPSAAGA